MRSPLVWLGKADPVKSMDKLRTEDPERIDMAELFSLVGRIFGLDEPFKARDLVNRADEIEHTSLRDILMRITDSRGAVSVKSLGKWLTGRKGQIVNGRRIVKYSASAHDGHRFMLSAVDR